MKRLAILLLPAAFTGCFHRNAFPEKFMIPQGFTGSVKVFYNDPLGVPKKYGAGRRVYEIPESAILITQFDADKGWMDQEYYYVSKSGGLRPILIDSTALYTDSLQAKHFRQVHAADTMVMDWGISGTDVNHKRYQELMIGTYGKHVQADSPVK